MPLPLTVSCFSKIQIGFTFVVLAYLGSPRQRAVKRVCVFSFCGSTKTLNSTVIRVSTCTFSKYLVIILANRWHWVWREQLWSAINVILLYFHLFYILINYWTWISFLTWARKQCCYQVGNQSGNIVFVLLLLYNFEGVCIHSFTHNTPQMLDDNRFTNLLLLKGAIMVDNLTWRGYL